MRRFYLFNLAPLFTLLSGTALSATGDKSEFTLFNPTPKAQMREMATDRPDKTEGATTVDAGHFQIETDLFNQELDKVDGTDIKTNSYVVGTTNFRIGLTNSTEINLIVTPYTYSETKENAVKEDDEGLGDTVIRFKYNFIGNDGGPFTIGVIPFIKIATADENLGNEKTEGGIILPVGIALPGDWGMGLMFEVDYLKNSLDNGYHNNFITSATVSHSIVGELGGYLEFFSETSGEPGEEWNATFDVGLTYGLSEDLQLDAGCNFGITSGAQDTNPFVGISARI